MMDNLTSNSNIILSMLINAAKKLGFPVQELIALLPNNIVDDANEETRYPVDKVPLIWQWLAQQTLDPNVGFRLAEQISLKSQTMLTFLLMSSKTLGAGLEGIIKFQQLVSDSTQYRLEYHGDDCSFVLQNNDDPMLIIRQQNEYSALLAHHWLSDLLGNSWQLKRIEFSHPQPNDISEYERFFQCELSFSAPVNRLVFDASLLNLAIPYANENMNNLHQQHAEKLAERLKKNKLIAVIKSLITKNLAVGDIHIQQIAQQCNLSERQLKTQLEHQATSFSELLDTTRKQQAVMMLTTTNKPIVDIADACGFAEPSTFNRAFKRWFQQTPTNYRRSKSQPM